MMSFNYRVSASTEPQRETSLTGEAGGGGQQQQIKTADR